MRTQAQAEQQTDQLGMTEEQWTQWQACTHGFGEQDENGVDVSLLRRNLRLSPWERLEKMERELAFFKEDGMKPDNDFQRIIAALDASGLRFVIIGGIAMRLQGASHITDDIGLAFARDPHSLEALVSALAPYHPRLRGAPAGLLFFWDLRTLQTSVNMTLETDAGSVDLVGEPDGVASFEDLWNGATIMDRQGVQVRVASVEALIAMKRAAGRPKDYGHLLELKRLLKVKAGE